MRSPAMPKQFLRGVLYLLQSAAAFYGFQHLPMANAYTFIFVMPIFTLIFAVLFLRENVTRLQTALMLIAFVGVLVVFRPGLDQINWTALVVLGGSAIGGLSSVFGRSLSRTEGFGASLIYPVISAIILAILAGLPTLHWPDASDWPYLIGASIFTGAANSLIVAAIYQAPVSQVAPTQYSQIIWGTIYGFLFFADAPDAWVIAGAGLIIFAGIWLARIEYRATHKQILEAAHG